MVVCLILIYLFIPTNPRLAAMRFLSFFFPFFSSYILYALLLLNHKTWKSNFCAKLLSCKRNYFSRNFLGQLHREPPKMGPQKINFLNGLRARVLVFFAISRYLTDKSFDIVWGCHPPPWNPQIDPPKNQVF